MRTPTRSSSRPSSTPQKRTREHQVSPTPKGVEDIPIDPALLAEEKAEEEGLEDGLEDAEGEIVDEDVELVAVQRVREHDRPSVLRLMRGLPALEHVTASSLCIAYVPLFPLACTSRDRSSSR